MTQELEWGIAQQLLLLVQSGVLGVVLGALFEIISGMARGKSKVSRFIADVIFCIFSALITFFFSLVVTDGRLHPVMFIGVGMGLLLEHISGGRWIGFAVYKCLCFIRKLRVNCSGALVRISSKCACKIYAIWCKSGAREENVKKTRKKHHFFQKKT